MQAIRTKNPKPNHPNVRLLQSHGFFLSLVFILPVIIPYYRDEIGLGFREFMLGEVVLSVVMILMEVPTGWLSDVWTRKNTLIVGTIANIMGFSLLWQADSFLMAATAQGVLGVGISLLSGTNSALLYDSLLETKEEDTFRKQEGFRHGIRLYAIGGSALIGGFLYQWNHDAPIILSLLTSVIALGVCFFLREPERQKEHTDKHPLADMLETVRYALRGHKEIAGIILLSSVLFSTTKVMLWAQQPYYILLELPASWFGILMAVGFLLGGLAGHYGHHLDGKRGNVPILAGLLAVTFFACLISGLWHGYHAIPLLLIGSLIWGFGFPHVQDAINKRVASARRATVLSTASFMIHVVSIPLMASMGWVGDDYGINNALLFMASTLAVAGIVALVFLRKRR